MATWARATNTPVTAESDLRFYDVDRPEREGYASVRWVAGNAVVYGGVFSKHIKYDREGTPESETRTVIDPNPTFA